jgi:hypothetical protein
VNNRENIGGKGEVYLLHENNSGFWNESPITIVIKRAKM